MSREDHAREGAQAVIPGEDVLDVAVVMPRGTTLAAVLGAAAGSAAGGSNALAWGIAGSMVAGDVNAAAHGTFPSLVLALTAERLHVLGRSRSGLVGGWKNLHPLAHIDRENLVVSTTRHGTVKIVGLTDRTTGATLEVEVQNVGDLGLGQLLGELA